MKGKQAPRVTGRFRYLLVLFCLVLVLVFQQVRMHSNVPTATPSLQQMILSVLQQTDSEMSASSQRQSLNSNLIEETQNSAVQELSAAEKHRLEKKRQRAEFRKAHREKPLSFPSNLTLPTPIFVMNLPKAGTSSVHKYFLCGGVRSRHGFGKVMNGTAVRAGMQWKQNMEEGKGVLDGFLPIVDAWTDIGLPYCGHCFFPSIHALDNIAHFYPNATIMLVHREATAWVHSLKKWARGSLKLSMSGCCDGAFPAKGQSDDVWVEWYNNHTASIRRFAAQNPSLTFVDLPLESKPEALEAATGVNKRCWLNYSPKKGKLNLTDDALGFTSSDPTVTSPGASSHAKPDSSSVTKASNAPNSDLSVEQPQELSKEEQMSLKKKGKRESNKVEFFPSNLTLPTPIFLMNLPKAGTSSVDKYFHCGGIGSAHGYAKMMNGTTVRAGNQWKRNVEEGKGVLDGFQPGTKVWTDIGVPYCQPGCFYPSIHALDNIAQFYPNATIMLIHRKAETWVQSIKKWARGGLRNNMSGCCNGAFPAKGQSDDVWVEWYNNHTASIRRFAAQNPSLTFVDLPLESKAETMEAATGIDQRCWVNYSPKKGKLNLTDDALGLTSNADSSIVSSPAR